jgi:DNA-binding CsgD family transcriptional regulator
VGSSGAGTPAPARAATVDVLDVLSPREREVLELVLKGWRNREIGRELCVSIKTVDTHRTRINRKLGCRSAGDLIRFAAANGLLDRAPVPRTAPRPSQTIVLVVDDVPELRTWLLDDMRAQGYQQRRVPTLTGAVAELAGLQTAAVFLVDGDQAAAARPAVRAVALLPDADAGERFVAALDRAADRSYAHASGANGVPAPGANVSAA